MSCRHESPRRKFTPVLAPGREMLITIYKCFNYDSFPKYLKDMFTLRQSRYSFRKTDILSLCKPVTTTYGLHSFRYFASKNWNSLPNNEDLSLLYLILEGS